MIKPKNLLIVRTDRIGDVILSLPLAGIVKKHFPECKVTFLLREYTRCLAVGNPNIDEIIILTEKAGKISLRKNISKISHRKFDSVILVYPTFITALIIFLSGIKNRIGTGYRWYSFLFNRKIYKHRKFAEKHELEFNVEMLNEFGIQEEVNEDKVIFNLKPEEKSNTLIEELFSANNIQNDKPVIIIHPGSGGSAVDLPLEKFKELVQIIALKTDSTIIITGTDSEKSICSDLVISDKIYNFAGKVDLAGLIALIDKSDIFISNSTGPIHIAAALGKFTIGFYPKILSCSPRRWGPYTIKKNIFTPEIECSNCTRGQCERLDCMSTIDPGKVFKSIEEVFHSQLRRI